MLLKHLPIVGVVVFRLFIEFLFVRLLLFVVLLWSSDKEILSLLLELLPSQPLLLMLLLTVLMFKLWSIEPLKLLLLVLLLFV